MSSERLFRARFLFLFVAILLSSHTWSAGEDYCRTYARHALEVFEVAQKENCENLTYPIWSKDFEHHYNWCRTVSEAEAERGGEQRVSVLRECRNRNAEGLVIGTIAAVETDQMGTLSRDLACQDYANEAANQQQGNLQAGCGYSGPQWNADYSAHYDWCIRGQNLQYAQGEQTKRQEALAQCAVHHSSPKSATVLPLLQPAIDPGIGGITPALDPGIADNNPAGGGGVSPIPIPQPLSVSSAQALSAPIGRAAMVNALMADSATRAALQALPTLHGMSPQDLPYQTLGGTFVSDGGKTNVAGSGNTTTANLAPAAGAKSPKDFNWSNGIYFSPLSPSPTYFLDGRAEPLAQVAVFGATVSNSVAESMIGQKVVHLGSPASVEMIIDLPVESATYSVAFSLSDSDLQLDPRVYRGDDAILSAHFYVGGVVGEQRLDLVPLSDGTGLVALVHVDAKDLSVNLASWGYANARLTIDAGFPSLGFVFGGFTVTQL